MPWKEDSRDLTVVDDLGEETGINHLDTPLKSFLIFLPLWPVVKKRSIICYFGDTATIFFFCFLPFADKVSVLSAEVTSKGDTGDSEHVLHYLPLITRIVGQRHRLHE